MDERIVNLNQAERLVVTVEVGDQRFSIRRVVTGARQLWSAFVVESTELLEMVAHYHRSVKDLRAKAGEPDPSEKIKALTAEVEPKVEAFAAGKMGRLYRIIEILLTKNGYAFDRAWWDENTSETDCRDFIIEAMTPGQSKKNEPDGGKSIGEG